MKLRVPETIRQQFTLFTCATGFLVWWIHAILNHLFPPNDTFFDLILFILASLCKLGLLISIPFFLRRVLRRLDHNRLVVKRCVVHWTLALAALLAGLTWFHDDIAVLLSNDVMRIHYVSDASALSDFHYVGRSEWLQRWNSGNVFVIEAALGVLAITLISGVGYWRGERKWTFLFLSLGLFPLISTWPFAFGLLLFDYDTFLGGIYSDSLALDLIWPMTAMDPSTEVTFTVLLCFVVASMLALRSTEPAAEMRASTNTLSSAQSSGMP